MDERAAYRELLIADLALVLGVAPARDVAFALQRYWEKRTEGASILDELRDVAKLSGADAARLEAEVDKRIAEAGGDARVALGARGGLDRSIHVELSRVATAVVGELADRGAGARSPLTPVAPERYLGFHEIGRGGMGVVYLALDSERNRRVALKMVRPAWSEAGAEAKDPLAVAPPDGATPASEAFRTLRARFLSEACVTGGLEHPGIVPVYELGETPKGSPATRCGS